MPIAHQYTNASDCIPQYEADRCGRQAITVAEYFADDRLADLTLYRFNDDNYEMGLDPWNVVELDQYMPGHEPNDEQKFVMGNSNWTRTWPVEGDRIVYVSKKALTKLGIAIPKREG